MDLQQLYLKLDGRIGIRTYWLKGVLPFFIIGLVAGLIDNYIEANNFLSWIVSVLLIWPGLAIQVKRWHDRNKSGWWVLIQLIPLVGAIWSFIELGFLKGSEGANKYGAETF
jgi:uncharacterized membrane protein YhaH (DUF805 family)